ncbi:MAG TPA: ribonuclease HII [Micropepsaceae bacterium]|nr:ribonuclease HII [Micropepsaceae bacterium]
MEESFNDIPLPGLEAPSDSGPSFAHEQAMGQAHGFPVAGIDEAGRGPWAGPVVAAAVILDPDVSIPGIDDSKRLTPKKRAALFDLIQEKALAFGVAFVRAREIDELNIRRATHLAMKRAYQVLCTKMKPASVLIDGNDAPTLSVPHRALVRGDRLSLSIAAASILAKVSRDNLMIAMDKSFPGYGFADHKGYGTPKHAEALNRLGVSKLHRHSFEPVRAVIEKKISG